MQLGGRECSAMPGVCTVQAAAQCAVLLNNVHLHSAQYVVCSVHTVDTEQGAVHWNSVQCRVQRAGREGVQWSSFPGGRCSAGCSVQGGGPDISLLVGCPHSTLHTPVLELLDLAVVQ